MSVGSPFQATYQKSLARPIKRPVTRAGNRVLLVLAALTACGVTMLLGILALLVAIRHVPAGPPPSRIGQQVTLGNSSGSRMGLATSLPALDAFNRASADKDYVRVEQLISAGHVIVVEPGTSARLLGADGTTVQVCLPDGTTGWVPVEFIH